MEMGQPSSSILSPYVLNFLEEMQKGLEEGVIPLSIYNDPEIYRLELERIFGRCWIFVGHESEIPAPGDYVVRYIGEDPFILVRDETGRIRVLFDSCRHRGTQICRADKGNASHFRCPYHGWTYKNTGELTGIPNRHQAYKQLNISEWSLLQAPQVDTYYGVIFACLDPETPALIDYLGDFRWYLDIHLRVCPDGMEVIGEPHRWKVDADWKSGAENFAGDSYHTQSLHRSTIEIGLAPVSAAGPAGGRNDIHVTECSGHTTSIRRVDPDKSVFWGYPSEVVATFRSDGLSPEQWDLARRSVVHTGTIFPNLSFIHIGLTDDPAKPGAAYLSFRQWQPKGPGKMEIWSWVLVPRSSPDWYKARAYKVAVATFSPSGNFEQDDTIVWGGVARAASGVFARKVDAKLNYQMGLEWMSDARVMPNWPGPGTVYDSNLEEGVQRTFFRHWIRELLRS
jgi:phenylpropionate dioxygenase-like ring-hydroxylating dioxygenase large terminal subunit